MFFLAYTCRKKWVVSGYLTFSHDWAILLERYSSATFAHDLESQKYVAMDRLAMLEAPT